MERSARCAPAGPARSAGGSRRRSGPRAAAAYSLLCRRSLAAHGGPRALRGALGLRERAWGWAGYLARLRARPRGRVATDGPPRFEPSRLDLAAMLAEIGLHTSALTP